jgi:hypothetical protein
MAVGLPVDPHLGTVEGGRVDEDGDHRGSLWVSATISL